MQKSFTFFLFFIFFSFVSQAQTNFQPGLVVTSTGDTLRGFINHKEWLRNPEEVTFKATISTPTEQKFTPATSRYVEVKDEEKYQSEKVSISLAPVLSNFSHGVDTATLVNTVFLRVLHTGKSVSLFSYTDKLKTRFYIKENNEKSNLQELMYRKYLAEGEIEHLVTEEIYRNQLWTIAIKNNVATDALRKRLKTALYNKQDLLELTQAIDAYEQQNPTISVKLPKTRFIAGIWLNRSSISQDGHSKFSDRSEGHDASYLPKISIGIDAFANPSTQRLLFRTELSVAVAKPSLKEEYTPPGSTLTYVYRYGYDQLSVSLNPQVLYNLYHTENLKLYLAAGLMATYSHFSNSRLTTTTYSNSPIQSTESATLVEDYEETPESFWYSITARAGVMFFDTVDVSVLYTASTISANRLHNPVNAQSISLGLNYLFNRKQTK